MPATLKELKKAGYKDILVQPTHLLHGEEYEHKVLTTVDKFKGDFDRIVVSDPLMVGKKRFSLSLLPLLRLNSRLLAKVKALS